MVVVCVCMYCCFAVGVDFRKYSIFIPQVLWVSVTKHALVLDSISDRQEQERVGAQYNNIFVF